MIITNDYNDIIKEKISVLCNAHGCEVVNIDIGYKTLIHSLLSAFLSEYETNCEFANVMDNYKELNQQKNYLKKLVAKIRKQLGCKFSSDEATEALFAQSANYTRSCDGEIKEINIPIIYKSYETLLEDLAHECAHYIADIKYDFHPQTDFEAHNQLFFDIYLTNCKLLGIKPEYHNSDEYWNKAKIGTIKDYLENDYHDFVIWVIRNIF